VSEPDLPKQGTCHSLPYAFARVLYTYETWEALFLGIDGKKPRDTCHFYRMRSATNITAKTHGYHGDVRRLAKTVRASTAFHTLT
jgi:hypothetical protein